MGRFLGFPILLAPLFLGTGCSTSSRGISKRQPPPPIRASIVEIDLMTQQGASQAGVSWRYADAIPDKNGQALEIQPKAGGATFDDSNWEAVMPEDLQAKRGAGKLSFGWYRTSIVVPATVAGRPTSRARLEFEIVVDDYAEVWVNGELPRKLGQAGSSVVAGFNSPNRVTLAERAEPGRRLSVAVFAMNGPISESPENFHFVRSAKLIFTWP